jgi:uncharacterized cupredoxin-like copper-binding protein
VQREVIAALRNYVNCWNQRKFEEAITLVTTDYMKSLLVLANPQDAIVVLNGLPPLTYTIRSVGTPRNEDDGRVSLTVDYTVIHQQKAVRWYFLKDDGRWFLDQEERLQFDLGVDEQVIDIEMTEFDYNVSPARVPKSPVIRLRIRNTGALPHEVVAVQVEEGVDPTTVLQPGVEPEGVTFVGQSMRVPGDSEEVVLTGLEPGRYLILCQLRFPGGPLHSEQGMLDSFTVE